MPTARFSHARIEGICTVPGQIERRIDDEIDLFGGDAAQIARLKKAVGLDRRRVAAPSTTALDLCAHAAITLLDAMGRDPAAIDALICVTQTPDHSQPSNAARLQARLGLGTGSACFDVNLGCSGFVYGIYLASLMVEAGGCRSVLLLAGDTLSRIAGPRDRSTAPLFGDAGSACLVSRDDTGATPSTFVLHTDGSGADAIVVPAGGARIPCAQGPETQDAEGNWRAPGHLHMAGAEVFDFSMRAGPQVVAEVLAAAGIAKDDVDGLLLHQANRYIVSNIARKLAFPAAKVPMQGVTRSGNLSSASIPGALCSDFTPPAGRPATLVLAGFGVGFSWAGAAVSLPAGAPLLWAEATQGHRAPGDR